jgi:hypothetical protein
MAQIIGNKQMSDPAIYFLLTLAGYFAGMWVVYKHEMSILNSDDTKQTKDIDKND